jgi:hypothetical protein
MSRNKLDGAFSGLWTCELCGKTGETCTCEHFARWGGGIGPDKTLSDTELAAEFWRQHMTVVNAIDRAYPWGVSEETERESERFDSLERIATSPDYREAG